MPYWRLFYHFVWSTKGRAPLIRAGIESRLYAAIRQKAEAMGAVVHAVGGTEDHVHLIASVPPALSLARFVGEVKGESSHVANNELAGRGEFAWQGDYAAVTLSEDRLRGIVRYVVNQRLHHREGTIMPHLEWDSAPPRPTARDAG
ncbi:MAG: IS200/IS605 family transposase [Anaerolineae bacterium]|nr:IS200/IS605 family transposase [Anaerolineae bacterium]